MFNKPNTMFTVNLEQELINSKKASLSSEEQVVLAEAEKILSSSTEEDMLILKRMGLDYSVEKSKNLTNKVKFLKAFNKTRVFSEDEIKDLCITYGLRFLPIDKYKGEVDPLVPSKVKDFEKTYNEVIEKSWRNEFNYNKFMICAPGESFELSARPKDPLLFYPINDSNGNVKDYFLVHKWGNDISMWNAIKAWKNRNFFTWITCFFTMYMMPLLFVASMLFNFKIGFGAIAITVVASFAWALLAMITTEGDFFSGKFHSDTWKSEYKD